MCNLLAYSNFLYLCSPVHLLDLLHQWLLAACATTSPAGRTLGLSCRLEECKCGTCLQADPSGNHEGMEYEEEGRISSTGASLSRGSSMSDQSSTGDGPKIAKRGKRMLSRIKGVFKP